MSRKIKITTPFLSNLYNYIRIFTLTTRGNYLWFLITEKKIDYIIVGKLVILGIGICLTPEETQSFFMILADWC